MKVPLIWTGKPQRVSGRLLTKGDPFISTRTDSKMWKAIGRAVDAPKQIETPVGDDVLKQAHGVEVASEPARRVTHTGRQEPEPAKEPEPDIEELRAQYEAKMKKPADRRWGLAKLTQALSSGRYARRDMRATED